MKNVKSRKKSEKLLNILKNMEIRVSAENFHVCSTVIIAHGGWVKVHSYKHCIVLQYWYIDYFLLQPRNLKGETGSLFDPYFKAMVRGHIGRHVWRWVILPSDLVRYFGTICVHYRYRVIQRTITYMRAWFKSLAIAGLAMKKSRGTITLPIPPHVTARWPSQQIPPLNFLGCNSSYSKLKWI